MIRGLMVRDAILSLRHKAKDTLLLPLVQVAGWFESFPRQRVYYACLRRKSAGYARR